MKIRNFFILTIATFFYVGLLPFIPGTFGSLAGVVLYLLLSKAGLLTYILFTCGTIALGFLAAGKAEQALARRDARYIVIDEVSGILISFILVPCGLRTIVVGFLLFRILDALKPFPCKRLENLEGASGIMFDDIIAGLYTNIILQVVLRLASFKAS